jgi:hypothetical protein
VEERLVPINALIGLATPDGLNRAVLAEAGFEIAGLEIPCLTDAGTVVIDVVLANRATGQLVACESKGGSNVEVAQAKCYEALLARTVVRSTLVTLRTRVEPTLEVLYAAMADNRDRMLLSLSEAGVRFPMLSISRRAIELCNDGNASSTLRDAFRSPLELIAPPGRYIPFDHESSPEIIKPYVKAALVAALSQQMSMISDGSLTERVAPHYPLYAVKAQNRLKKLVGQVASELAASNPETFQYNGSTANHDGFIKFMHSPEQNDPRGRTQAYQRLARGGRRSPRVQQIEGQGDLLDELEKADDNEEQTASDETEGDRE